MYMAYGIDYRKAAIEFKQNGNTFTQSKKVFKITPRTHTNGLNSKKKQAHYNSETQIKVYFNNA